jgi:hypothetical protein
MGCREKRSGRGPNRIKRVLSGMVMVIAVIGPLAGSSALPSTHAQHVWRSGKMTSTPRLSRRSTAAIPTRGYSASTIQVAYSATLGRGPV